jgi:hypothetical protein
MMDSGRLTEPHDCEAAIHAWWRRAGNPSTRRAWRAGIR